MRFQDTKSLATAPLYPHLRQALFRRDGQEASPAAALVQLANKVAHRWLRDGSYLVRLDKELLLAKAKQHTGLEDFGDPAFLEPFGILLECLDREASLHIVGRLSVFFDLVRQLRNRLCLVADRQRHPEIASEVVRAPLFITGLPRSGTTFLHALLAQDPRHRSPRVWEIMYPSPPPERSIGDADPRIARTARDLEWLPVLMPEFESVHLIGATLPQECIAITSHTFLSYVFEAMYYVPTYRAWHDRQDKRPAYEFHRRFLQHLQWRWPGERWVLKAPSHLLALEALFEVYPDAGIILTHRDPLKVLPSCGSFTEVLRRGFSHEVNKVALGREIEERWVEGARLAVATTQGRTAPPERFFHVKYNDLVREPLGVVARIYRHFGWDLTPEARAACESFCLQHPKDKKGVHRYSLEEFGWRREEERERFRFYVEHFDIEREE